MTDSEYQLGLIARLTNALDARLLAGDTANRRLIAEVNVYLLKKIDEVLEREKDRL